MTLVEILIGTMLLAGGGGMLLFGMHYAMMHTGFLRQAQVAMNAAQGQLEQLAAADFDALTADAAYCASPCPGSNTRRVPLVLDGPDGQLAIQIRPVPLTDTTPDLLDIHVAACWQHGRRAIGEANGATACADGADANWWVDTPVMVSIRVARRG